MMYSKGLYIYSNMERSKPMKCLIYIPCFIIFFLLADINSTSAFYSIICPLIAIASLALVVFKLLVWNDVLNKNTSRLIIIKSIRTTQAAEIVGVVIDCEQHIIQAVQKKIAHLVHSGARKPRALLKL